MRRAPVLAVALTACGYSWTPPQTSSPTGVSLAGATVPSPGDPGELAVAVQGQRGSRRPPRFTFVDGRGHELTANELSDRYTRTVGRGDVDAILSTNKVLAETPWLLLLAAGTFVSSTAVLTQRSGCSPGGGDAVCKSVVLAGIAGLDALVVWAIGLFKDPRETAVMDLDDADFLVRRYNAALGHPQSPSTSDDQAAADLAGRANVPRFRSGIGLVGGPWVLPGQVGGAGGIGVQLGAQVNDAFGVYYAGTLAGDSTQATQGAVAYTAIMGDVTLGVLQLGAGPSLDLFATGVNKTGSTSSPSGAFFGLACHAGLAVGPPRPGAKPHLMIGVDVHPTIIRSSASTTLLVALGVARF